MVFTIILVYFSYSLMFWGGTLLNGGPQNTGSWPFLYTLTGLGQPPPQAGQQQQQGQQVVPGVGQVPGQGSTPATSGGQSSLGAAVQYGQQAFQPHP